MLKKILSSPLRRHTLSGFIASVINTGLLAISYPLYLKFLGYNQFGVWVVLATVLNLAQLGNLGIGPAVTKLVAEEHSGGNLDRVHRYIATATLILIGSGTLVLVSIWVFASKIVAAFALTGVYAAVAL